VYQTCLVIRTLNVEPCQNVLLVAGRIREALARGGHRWIFFYLGLANSSVLCAANNNLCLFVGKLPTAAGTF